MSAKASEAGPQGAERSLEDALLRALGREVLRLSRRRVHTPEGSIIDRSSFRILWALREMGPLSLGDLENVLQLEQSTVNRQVKAAIRHGLAEFHLVPGNRRRLLYPTDEGVRAYLYEGALQAEVFKRALAEFGHERIENLAAELKAFNDAIDDATTAPPDR